MTENTWRETAEANLRAARKKHGRIGSKKSRTGCSTCKSRHLKCDELWPRCKKCSISGRICNYNTTAFTATSDNGSQSSSGSDIVSTIFLQPSQSLGLYNTRTFDYFRFWAAPRFAGALDRDFWCRKVLVLAHTEPAVLHGLLALSVLYEHPQFMKSWSTSPGGDYSTPKDHPNFSTPVGGCIDGNHAKALKHYNRSMQLLRAQSASGVPSPTLALLSCVIFIAIELARDSVFSALALLNHGAVLIGQMPSCPEGMDEGLFSAIKFMLLRLSVLAAVYGHLRPLKVLRGSIKVVHDVRFTDMNDARDALTVIIGDIYMDKPNVIEPSRNERPNPSEDRPIACGNETAHPATQSATPAIHRLHYGCDDRVSSPGYLVLRTEVSCPAGLLHHRPELLETQSRLRGRLLEWYAAFKATRESDHKTACILLMIYHVSLVTVDTWLSSTQLVFDQYTHNFQEIICLAEVYQKENSHAEHATTFSFEVGALGPLYYVATKCRVPSIRKRAIHLMSKCPKKESTNNAKSVAELVSRIVAIEEEDLGHLEHSGESRHARVNDTVLPAEQNRVSNFEIIINRAVMRHEIRVWRCSGTQQGEGMDYPI